MSALRMGGATPGAGRGNRGGDLLEVFGREAERGGIELSVYLRRASCADDGGGYSRPCQGPCERHARNAGTVSRRAAIGCMALATFRLRTRTSPVKSAELERQSSLGRDRESSQ